MADYRSTADMLAAEKAKANDQTNSDLLRAFLQQRIQGQQALEQGHQAASLKDLLDTNKANRDQAGLQQMVDSGLIQEGSGGKVGEVSITKGFDPNKANAQSIGHQRQEAGALNKMQAPISQAEDLIATNKQFQNSLDLGSSVGDKNAAILAAKLGEGMKARIQQAVIQEFLKGSNETAEGAIAKAQNWMDGKGETTLPPGARNQLRALGQMHYVAAKDAYNSALDTFKKQAPLNAPTMVQNGTFGQYAASVGSRGAKDIDELEKRFSQRQQQGAPAIDQQVQQNQPAPQGLAGFFSGLFKGRQPPQPIGSQVGTQPVQSNPGPANTPTGGANANDPEYQRLLQLRAKAGQ